MRAGHVAAIMTASAIERDSGRTMTVDAVEYRELVRHWIEDGWNGNNNEAVMLDVFAADWIDGNPELDAIHGHAGVRDFVTRYRAAFPDVRLAIERIIADPETKQVAFRWIAEATHLGLLGDIEPTGRRVRFSGVTIHRVEHGKFVESWNEVDRLGLFAQLGLLPSG